MRPRRTKMDDARKPQPPRSVGAEALNDAAECEVNGRRRQSADRSPSVQATDMSRIANPWSTVQA